MHDDQKQTCSSTGTTCKRREESRLSRGERGTPSTVGESTGTALALTEKDIVRFWSKVDKNGPLPDQSNPHYTGLDRCWVWTAGKFNHGYGLFRLGLKTRTAHRVAWEITNGQPIPHGEGYHGTCVIHLCDQKICCNPSHLQIGSHIDNMMDRENKGRNNPLRGDAHPSRVNPEYLARGDRHGSRTKPGSILRGADQGSAKLNDDLIVMIRTTYAQGGSTQRTLAAKFGISQTNISRIILRKIWVHVPPTPTTMV